MICSFELFIYYSTYAMNEEPIRVHVRGLNNTPNSVQWGHASMRFTGFTGLFGLVRSRKCRINVASPSFFLGH